MKKYKINKPLCVLYFTLNTLFLQSQDYKLYVASTQSNSIQLKWMSKKINLESSFNLYRKSDDNSSWTKINEKSIQRANPLTDAELDKLPESDENYALAQYSSAFLDIPKEHLNNYRFLLLSAILDNKLAEYCGIYFIDKSIDPNKFYTYKLTDGSDKELAISKPLKYGTDGSYSAIQNLEANTGNKVIELNWIYNSDFQIYKAYRDDTKSLLFIPTQDDISASKSKKFPYRDADTSLVDGKSYAYQIVGLDYFGRETPKSNQASALCKDLTKPPAAQGLRVEYKAEKYFHISWRNIDKAKVVQTNLYKSQTKTGTYQKIYTGDAVVYDDKDIKNESDYYYVIEVLNRNGISAYTDTVRANVPDLTPPAIPMNVKAITDTGYIKILWDANTEKDLQGYFVFRGLKSDEGNFTPLFAEPIKENYFEDRHPAEVQNKIVYKICAVDIHSNRSKQTQPIFVQMPDKTAPSTPSFTNVEFVNGETIISWTKVYDFDVKEYEIQRGTLINDSTFGNYISILKTTQTSFSDISIEANKQYNYSIAAIDSSGNVSEKNYRSIYTKTMRKEVKIENFNAQKAEQAIKITWQNPNRAPVQVLKKENDGTFIPLTSYIYEAFLEDNEVKPGSTYSYKIRTEGEESDWESQEIKIEF